MSRLINIGIIILLGVVALAFILPVAGYYRREPTVLTVHVESLPWKSVTIEPHNSSPLFFQPSNQVRVSPIYYGKYRIGVQLTNGQALWSEYYHMDAGVRRHVDISITTSSGHYRLRVDANQYHNTFDVRPEDATEQKPFLIPW